MNLLEFLQNGPERRRKLDEAVGNFMTRITPPNLRPAAEFVAEANPIQGMERSMQAGKVVFDPEQTAEARKRAALDMGVEVAFAVSPAVLARMGYLTPTQGLTESLTGRSPEPSSVGEAAAKTYKVGQFLQKADGYKGAGGKPSAVMLPNQGRFEARPISPIEDAAISYMKKRGMDTKGFDEYPPFSEERASFVAAAYDMMKHAPDDPDVKKAYDAMIQETMDQYKALKDSGIEFKFMKEGMDDPYAASPALGYQDVVERGNLWVFPTDFGFGTSTAFDPKANPLLQRVGKVGDKEDAVANDAFRAVHDIFGHFGSGNPFFRHKGEERAFLEHSRMYSPEARGAMASETRGQNSWLNFGPHGEANRTANTLDTVFADQKTGLMPRWATEADGMPSDQERISLMNYLQNWKAN